VNARRDRRHFFRLLGAAGSLAWFPACTRRAGAPEDGGAVGSASWFPEKARDLILHTDRPPNLEMPARYFVHDLTPNDAMFVRWHLSKLPESYDLGAYRLKVGGHLERPLSLALNELKGSFSPVSIVAVNQCSGNGRASFAPNVPGVQWGGGAVGNARWTGVRLKEVLERAVVKQGAVDVTFGGLDGAPLAQVPDFVKSLDVGHAMDPDVLLAYAMNDAPLPMLNGFPLRLVVPGWFSTYWVKALDEITVLPQAFDGFWMKKAYRVPKTADGDENPADLAKETVPITRLVVRSLFAHPLAGDSIDRGNPCEVHGVAFDGGSGIAKVELSTDAGSTWQPAALGEDLGKYAWRRWRATWTPAAPGRATLVVRATSTAGETQREAPRWNRGGYLRNEPERIDVTVNA
jgi:sulfite dehydrogenase (cytochrome) subunit A